MDGRVGGPDEVGLRLGLSVRGEDAVALDGEAVVRMASVKRAAMSGTTRRARS